MNKLKKLKQVLKSPPPERLAEIEYKSHFLQMVGITAVCIVLILKGFWYIIFALIFGVGVSYSQGITAYQKFKMIKSLTAPEKPENFRKDISPSRRRSKIINFTLGPSAKWLSIITAVVMTYITLGNKLSRWTLMWTYPLSILIIYIFFYYFISYWVAEMYYEDKLNRIRRR